MTAMPRKKGGEVTPRRLSDLEPHRRRAVVIRAVLSIALTWVASLTVYYLAPIGRAGRVREGLWLVIGLLLVGVLVFRRTRQILAADFPGLRAVEGLAVILPLFLLVFAALYLALSQGQRRASANSWTTPGRSTSPSRSLRRSGSATSPQRPTRPASS